MLILSLLAGYGANGTVVRHGWYYLTLCKELPGPLARTFRPSIHAAQGGSHFLEALHLVSASPCAWCHCDDRRDGKRFASDLFESRAADGKDSPAAPGR